jgi:acyl-CoA oxidase
VIIGYLNLYNFLPRQGAINQQIIDYQAQHVNLLPAVAGSYVYQFVYSKMAALWTHIQSLGDENPAQYLGWLPDIHSSSAGIKALSTWWGTEVLENCRRACGGHAYSAYNAIAGIIGDWGVLTTGGGDNFPMAQQCARYVLACVSRGLKGKKNIGSAAYLDNAKAILSQPKFALKSGSLRDEYNSYLNLISFLVVQLGNRLNTELSLEGKSDDSDAWNSNMVDLIRLSNLHSYRYVFQLYSEILDEVSKSPEYASLLPTLEKCGVLFVSDAIRREMLDLCLLEGYLSAEQTKSLKVAVFEKAKDLRKDVVGLTDGNKYLPFRLW